MVSELTREMDRKRKGKSLAYSMVKATPSGLELMLACTPVRWSDEFHAPEIQYVRPRTASVPPIRRSSASLLNIIPNSDLIPLINPEKETPRE